MTEADDQAKVVRWAKLRGYFVRKTVVVGNKGWPDLFVGNERTRRSMYVEMKNPSGGREDAHQKLTKKHLHACGVHVVAAWGADQAKAAIATYLDGAEYLGEFKA